MIDASGATSNRAPTSRVALKRSVRTFGQALPVVLGMLLLTSLILELLPRTKFETLFGRHEMVDVLLATVTGSVAMGHPLAGYVLGGELLTAGIGLVAVTALIVSWVTVGVVQLPAEALLLGRRFAILRNLLCAFSAIAIGYITVWLLQVLG